MKVIPVTDIKKVDPARYIEGDIFLSEKHIGVLHQGTIEPLVKESALKDYVKKKDVVKLVNDTLKKVTTDVK